MDPTLFKAGKTGQLLSILTPSPDFAFVPDPLPSAWQFDSKLWPFLAEALEHLGRLDGMARTLPHPGLLLSPLQKTEALTSSRLEGTYATAEEIMLFELDPREPKNANDPANNWQEINNYNRSLAQGFQELENLPFCLRLLTDLHKTLLHGARGSAKNPGVFRAHQVHIGSNKRYIAPPPVHMLERLHNLERYMNDPLDNLPPLVRCFVAHYQLEAIHPFSDGNGRIGRVILSLMIYKWCNLKMPWLYLSPYFERYKDEYITNLFRVSTEGAWTQWIEFCLRGVTIQAKDAVKKCDELRDLRENMRCRVHDGGGRAAAIIDGLFEHPVVTVGNIKKKHNVSHPTAKSDIDYLISKGILKDLDIPNMPNLRPRPYYSPEISSIIYREQQF